MRWRRFIIIALPMAAVLLLAASIGAAGGQADDGLDLTGSLPGASSAESGKPRLGGWPSAAPEGNGAAPCAPPLPCGTRLLGAVRKNGAVELQVPALRW